MTKKKSDCELEVMAFVELIPDRIIKELATRATSIETRHQEAQTTDFDGDLKRADDFVQGLCITVQYLTRQVFINFFNFLCNII